MKDIKMIKHCIMHHKLCGVNGCSQSVRKIIVAIICDVWLLRSGINVTWYSSGPLRFLRSGPGWDWLRRSQLNTCRSPSPGANAPRLANRLTFSLSELIFNQPRRTNGAYWSWNYELPAIWRFDPNQTVCTITIISKC